MSILHDIINEEDTFAIADQVLASDLPRIDECEPEEHDTFVQEIRWALTQKVQHAVLLAALKERQSEEKLSALFARGEPLVMNPSYVASVQEWVLTKYGLRDQAEFHPDTTTVTRLATESVRRIFKALEPFMLS